MSSYSTDRPPAFKIYKPLVFSCHGVAVTPVLGRPVLGTSGQKVQFTVQSIRFVPVVDVPRLGVH